MEKQKLIYVESKALFSPSSVSNKAIVFIKDTKEIWTHGTYFICSNVWATPITLTLSGDSTGSVSIDGSGNVTLLVENKYLTGIRENRHINTNDAVVNTNWKIAYYVNVLAGSTNLFPVVNNANAILTLNTHDYTFNHQLGFSSNKGIYHRTRSTGTWETSWREILTSTNYTKYPHTFASLTNKPTTISGYGITDSIPIIKGGAVTTDTDLSTLGMTTIGAKLSVFHLREGPYPTWLNVPYMNVLMFRSTSDSYGAIGIEMTGNHTVLFIGGRNAETAPNNVPNWWFRIKGASGTTYDLNSFLNVVNNYVTINTNQAITSYKIFKATAPADDREAVYYNIGLKLTSFGDNHKKVAAIGMGNESNNWYKAAIGFERTGTYDRGDIVFLFNNITDKTTCAYSDIKVRINAVGNINTLGTVSASGFKKTDSSDSYVLLGGGGHKLLSDLNTSHTHSYLPLSGGTMTGILTLTTDTAYINDTQSGSAIFGTVSTSNTFTGISGLETIFAGRLTNMVLRTSGNNLWHYNHANSARYLILDANNYTNYTIPYSNSNVTSGALGAFIYNGGLLYNTNFVFRYFNNPDTVTSPKYLLIAKLVNYKNSDSSLVWTSYGLSGLMTIKRGGYVSSSGCYNITAWATVGPNNGEDSRLSISFMLDSFYIIPVIVLYESEYYLAFQCRGSSSDIYFYGYTSNLLSSPISVNDASLITVIKTPEDTTSTHLYYYNAGDPKKFLHEGNYSNYALPLSGGTLTGILRSTQVAGNLGTSPIVCTGNVTSAAGINNTYSHLASNLAASGVLLIFIGKASSAYNGCSIGYLHRGDGNNTNAITLGLHSANNLLIVQGNGNVGIGNTSPSYKLSVNGDIYSSGYVRGNSGFIKTDSSNSYVLLGGGGHKLLSDLSSAHTHDWSSITSKPSLLGAMAKPIFFPYSFFDLKLGAYISTINNRFYSADLRYTVTTTNFASGSVHYLFDDNYDNRMQINMGTTATITIEDYNFVYNNGYIILSFYMYSAYPLLLPKTATVVATTQSGTTYTLNRATSVEAYGTMAFSIGLEYLTKLEITIVSLDDAYCGITNIDYYSRRTENTVRDCAVVTKYNANTLYHNLTAPKYIVKNGTSSQFLKADGSLDSNAYLPLSGGTMTGALNFANNTWNKVGDDVYIGDCNVGGMLGIKSAYSDCGTGFAMYNSGGTLLGKLYASGTSLYWSGVKLLTSTGSAQEAYLAWGGQNLHNSSSPIDAALAPALGANRLAFLNPNAIDIEYSRDGGTTWIDYGASDASKATLFITNRSYPLIYLGKDSTLDTSIDRTSWRLRVTISLINLDLYCQFVKFMIFVTDYGNVLRCTLLGRRYSDVQNNVDTWVTFLDAQLNGWSGWNTINHPAGITIPHTGHYGQIRFDFYITRLGTSGYTSSIQKILGFAPASWWQPSNMASFGDIYNYDWQLNVTFPAQVTATGFSGNLTGNVTGNLTGNAGTASKWKDARTITLTGDVTGSVSLDGSSNVTLTTATSGSGTSTFLKCPDKRNLYPALIVTSGGNIGAAFTSASTLGLSEGSHYEALILRGWTDSSGGNDNALLFSKDTSSVYHSQYAFGSTTTWGTMYKFLDSGNYKNYVPTLTGEGATGTWGINISGTANKVANALTLLLNGGTTSGTNKFVYDGSSAYTVNITPDSIGAATSSHTHSYLPLSGGTLGNTSAIETLLRLTSGTATLRLIAYSNTFNYIQSGTADFSGNAVLQITGYNGNVGSDLYLKFNNIYCRAGNYINIDSGNYGSYALPLSGGTMTGTLNTTNIYPKAHAGFNIGSTSSYYNTMYAYYFKKYGSDDNYLLLGGGGHKAVSDFAPNNVATLSSSGMGNSDLWTLVFEKSYPANYWYAPTTMFYIRSGTAGCGILCFYNYWASGTQLDDYEREVWFFGALKSETGITFGGANRDINDFFRIYIDKANFKYCIYYNRYNDLSLKILELLFFTVPEPGEYLSTGSLRSSFFTNSTTVVDLPTESSTLVRVPIKTTYNHDRTIKTTKSIYASSFYENSDIRLKENVRGIDLSDLTKLVDLVQFNFKDGGTKKYGVIAQLLELVGLQNLVYENNGNKAVDYISLLVLEIQRLRNEIGELKLEINKKN